MSNKYVIDCPECGGELMGTVGGLTQDIAPALYPVACMKCDWKGAAELKSEREAFNAKNAGAGGLMSVREGTAVVNARGLLDEDDDG